MYPDVSQTYLTCAVTFDMHNPHVRRRMFDIYFLCESQKTARAAPSGTGTSGRRRSHQTAQRARTHAHGHAPAADGRRSPVRGRYPVRRQAVRCRLSPGHRTPRFPAAGGLNYSTAGRRGYGACRRRMRRAGHRRGRGACGGPAPARAGRARAPRRVPRRRVAPKKAQLELSPRLSTTPGYELSTDPQIVQLGPFFKTFLTVLNKIG